MSHSLQVLVIDVGDQLALRHTAEHLRLEGHTVSSAASQIGARRKLVDELPDVVLLGDAGSAAQTLGLLRELRAGELAGADPQVKVVSVGADRDSIAVLHYRAGAHLALPSTATPELVAAAIETVAGETPATQAATSWQLRVGTLTLDVESRTASSGDESVRLSPRESDLLRCLAKTPGTTVTRLQLSRDVYGSELMAHNSRTIDAHMWRLRGKLGHIGEAERLRTLYGNGFRLER